MKYKQKSWKKLTQEDKQALIGFMFGWGAGLLGFILVMAWFVNTPLYDQKLNSLFVTPNFKIVANNWEDSQVVDSLSYLCSLDGTNYSKVYCVYKFIEVNMDIGYHDENTNRLNKPDEIFNSPSVCRDGAVLFMSTMNKMGFKNEFIHEPGHVYNIVYLENMNCTADTVNSRFKCEQKI